MNLGQSDLNPSSLIDLKAELHKKYESIRKEKLVQNSETTKRTTLKNKGNYSSKEKKCVPTIKLAEDNAEELALQKSRTSLEAKAKLYEKIISSNTLIDDDESDRFLVDFQRKVLYRPLEPAKSERDDIKNNKSSDEVSDLINPANEKSSHKPAFSEDLKITKLDGSDPDQPIHYQNVQYNEVRDHGTGYFAFSTDEAKRKEQMEELSAMRQETEEQRLARQRMLRKRKAMLQTRLEKLCERRNIDKSVVESYTSIEDGENITTAQEINLDSIPLPEMEKVSETVPKEPKIRPWDIGKTNFEMPVPQRHKIKSQSAWIEERRSERPSEFAPPSLYTK